MTKVRSAIATILALAGLLACAQAPAAAAEPSVTVAFVHDGVRPKRLAAQSPSISPGLMSSGLGSVTASQTYLDISQGARLFNSLYPEPIPPLVVRSYGVGPGGWARELERAAGAPAEIVPGLLAETLLAAGVPVGAGVGVRPPGLVVVQPDGAIARRGGCAAARCPGLTVLDVSMSRIAGLASRLRDDDLLIVIEKASPSRRLLTIGVAGRGFEGNLRSPTTRTDGYVLSTDLAPTILERFGLAAPSEMTGRPVGSTGVLDLDALTQLRSRFAQISSRRHPVLGVNMLIWAGLLLGAIALWRRRGAAIALPIAAATLAWVPALLLLGAALEPSVLAERLLVGVGAPALAAGSLLGLRALGASPARAACGAFAAAAAISIGATGVDVLAGSGLTRLSLLGPNPQLGVRFFGIGNELEAVIGTLLALGSGAAIVALAPRDPRRAVAVLASVAAFVAVVVFAPGRFGADVGAAITFPAGAIGVVLAALGLRRRRTLLLVLAVPLAAVGLLLVFDLVTGGDAHLSRSVLDAGGLDTLGEVVERRLLLSARSFRLFYESLPYALALAAIVAALAFRRRVARWLAASPALRAGFVGGIAASLVGALANDSGALLILIGVAYLTVYVGLAWAGPYSASDSGSG